MSGTKRTKSPSPRRVAADAAVSVIGKTTETVPVMDSFGDLDDILGEIAPPAKAAPEDSLDDILGELAPPATAALEDSLDDILGELAGPAKAVPEDSLDDILGELAPPAKAAPEDSLDDILGELARPAKAAPEDSLDDILGELAPPAKAAPEDSLDDILSDVSGPGPIGPAEAKPSRKRPAAATLLAADDRPIDHLGDMLDEMAAGVPAAEVAAPPAIPVPAKKPGGKARRLLGVLRPNLKGKREISRKAYAGMQGAIVVLGLAAFGQGAFILMRPAHAPAKAVPVAAPVLKVTVVPVDYSKVDLDRYIGKVRSLSEGGRDMLRHPSVKAAVINLDGGEQLYKTLRGLAARSAPADRISIRDDRVTIASCSSPDCAEGGFRLVYDIRHKQAAVCTTEKYRDGATMSYAYTVDGNGERPHC